MAMWGPGWWHHHGSKMVVKEFDEHNRLLVIVGGAARIRIAPVPLSIGERWSVQWEVIYSQTEKTVGHIFFTVEELKAAFGLTDDVSAVGRRIIQRFGGQCAEQGKYIRSDDFLNIPCPGTGHDGDPNVSIKLDDKMKDVVRKLLAT